MDTAILHALARAAACPTKQDDPSSSVPTRKLKELIRTLQRTVVRTAQQLDGLQGRGRHGTFLRSISQFYLDYHRCLFFFQLFLFSYLDFHTWMGGHAAPQGCSEC